MLVNEYGPAVRTLDARARHPLGRAKVPGLPASFRFHDLRHYFASLLIASGAT